MTEYQCIYIDIKVVGLYREDEMPNKKIMVSLAIDRELWMQFRKQLESKGINTFGRYSEITKLTEKFVEDGIDEYLRRPK